MKSHGGRSHGTGKTLISLANCAVEQLSQNQLLSRGTRSFFNPSGPGHRDHGGQGDAGLVKCPIGRGPRLSLDGGAGSPRGAELSHRSRFLQSAPRGYFAVRREAFGSALGCGVWA